MTKLFASSPHCGSVVLAQLKGGGLAAIGYSMWKWLCSCGFMSDNWSILSSYSIFLFGGIAVWSCLSCFLCFVIPWFGPKAEHFPRTECFSVAYTVCFLYIMGGKTNGFAATVLNAVLPLGRPLKAYLQHLYSWLSLASFLFLLLFFFPFLLKGLS